MGQAVAGLARGLRALGHEAEVAVPLTRQARETGCPRRTRKKFVVEVGAAQHPCELWQGETPEGVPVWFLRRDEFFDRSGLYGNESGDYSDNAARFIFLSKAAVEVARRIEACVLNAHGWHTALCSVFAKHAGLACPVVLTPHGLDFQGNFWSHDFALTNLPGHYFSAAGLEFYGSLNFLKGGLVFADAVVLPGELFVAAAQTSEYGCGLEKVLAGMAPKLHGIPDPVNGWGQLAARPRGGSHALPSPRPLALVFAEASQGLELLVETADRLVHRGLSILVLGAPSEAAEGGLVVAERKHPGRFVHWAAPSEDDLARAVAEADFLLLPGTPAPLSPWLPRCLARGLALIARRSPGLPAYTLPWPEGAGFYFREASPEALSDAAAAALEALALSGREDLARRAQAVDFSERAWAAAYAGLFEKLAGA